MSWTSEKDSQKEAQKGDQKSRTDEKRQRPIMSDSVRAGQGSNGRDESSEPITSESIPNSASNSVRNSQVSTEETEEETSFSKSRSECSELQHLSASLSDCDNALTNEAYLFMKKMLPSYVVNCFMATGYDTLSVLAEMNDESLAEIEDIINKEYPNESCFRHQAIPTHFLPSSNIFKFQPGHRKRIKKFVEEVKQLLSSQASGKQKIRVKRSTGCRDVSSEPSKPSVKYFKRSVGDASVNENLSWIATDRGKECFSELDLLTDFRQSFAKWQRQQKNQEHKEIKENQDFLVKISTSGADNAINASVSCYSCGKVLSLGVKSNKILLSNWTRHITHVCHKTPRKSSKSLDNYFTKNSGNGCKLICTGNVHTYVTS